MAYKIIRRLIPLAFLATALCGLVYLAVQQSLRQDANDPQIQMAEDAAAQVEAGTSAQGLVGNGNLVDLAQSLSPYLVFYNASGQPIAGNGTLDYALPVLPAGVFQSAVQINEDRFTWQPESDVRQAVVLVHIPGTQMANGATVSSSTPSFVMAGRSLREVEIRESHAGFEAGMICFFTILGLLILEFIFALIELRWMKK